MNISYQTLLYITLAICSNFLFTLPSIAQEVNCSNLDNSKTYQGLCTYGAIKDTDCQFYTLVENFGDIPEVGPLISKTPYFIKTPDIDISSLVNCQVFSGYITKSNQRRDHLILRKANSPEEKIFANIYDNFYVHKGELFINSVVISRDLDTKKKLEKFLQDQIKQIAQHVKANSNAHILDIRETGLAIRIENITVAETMLIIHQYGSKFLRVTWTDQGGNYLMF